MAERTGKILDIGRYMLDRAVAQDAAWERDGRDITVSVNVAAPQISATLFDDVRAALARHKLSPRYLELEITESALLQSYTGSMSFIQRIRDLGVAVALDDFGTGYSSLSYLSELPIDRVKIDRSFVSRLDIPRTRHIVEGIVSLCQALGLAVTAEGVETPDQAEALRAIGCDEWQGFLFAGPAIGEEVDWQAPQVLRAAKPAPRSDIRSSFFPSGS
jgi:EAL domain-containing protein (putative c-di-GMP-specific phosphodiesterase class I)